MCEACGEISSALPPTAPFVRRRLRRGTQRVRARKVERRGAVGGAAYVEGHRWLGERRNEADKRALNSAREEECVRDDARVEHVLRGDPFGPGHCNPVFRWARAATTEPRPVSRTSQRMVKRSPVASTASIAR